MSVRTWRALREHADAGNETLKLNGTRDRAVTRARSVPHSAWAVVLAAIGPGSPEGKLILHAARREPGLTVSELVARLPFGWSTYYRHVEALQDERLITFRRDGRAHFVYVTEDAPARRARKPRLSGAAREIAVAIVRHPGVDIGELLTRSDVAPRMIYHHVRNLVNHKLVKSSSTTRYRDLTPTDLLFETLGLDPKL